MRSWFPWAALGGGLILLSGCWLFGRQPTMQGMDILHAPDFPAGAQWFNTDRPLSLKALRGKFVLLDFWTYC